MRDCPYCDASVEAHKKAAIEIARLQDLAYAPDGKEHRTVVFEQAAENERLKTANFRMSALLTAMIETVDTKNIEMRSPEIGEPENGIPMHEWHDEWLHNVRTVLDQN